MNIPSGPSEKRDHGDCRSYGRPVLDQTARDSESREYTNNMPMMPAIAAPVTLWPLGPSVRNRIECCCRVKNGL